MPPDLVTSYVSFVQPHFFPFAEAGASPDPQTPWAQMLLFPTKSSQMSFCKTISLLICLKPSLVSTPSETYLCLCRLGAPEGTSHITPKTEHISHWIGPACMTEITLASAHAALWPVWVPGVEGHSFGFMTQKTQRTLLGKRSVCISVSRTHDTSTTHIYQAHKVVAWKLGHFNTTRTHK